MSVHCDIMVDRGAFKVRARFSMPRVGCTGLFGPSGAGKTTLVRALAGLEATASGSIEVNGCSWLSKTENLPTYLRGVGMVFQDGNLLSFLTVAGNLEFAMRRQPKNGRRSDRSAIVDSLGIGQLLEKWPSQLSGGERQRVAIARTLLNSPELLILDEPVSALDRQSRWDVLPFLARTFRELAIPVFYVSHGIDELAFLATNIILMESGNVIAAGPTAEILTNLELPLAKSRDAESVFTARAGDYDDEFCLLELHWRGGIFYLPTARLPKGTVVNVRVQARDVSLALVPPMKSTILNVFPGLISSMSTTEMGSTIVCIDCLGSKLLARITARSASELELKVGQKVFAQVKAVAILP